MNNDYLKLFCDRFSFEYSTMSNTHLYDVIARHFLHTITAIQF